MKQNVPARRGKAFLFPLSRFSKETNASLARLPSAALSGINCVIVSPSVILEKTIRIPRSLSVKAASILKGFLNKNPADRLGCHKETGFMEIMSHPFFKTIEWELVSEGVRDWIAPRTSTAEEAL